MRNKIHKTRCIKQSYSKCESICKTYDKIQTAGAALLEQTNTVESFRCNVELIGLDIGDGITYCSDFVAKTKDGDLIVRECVGRVHLTKPKTAKLLEASRQYWVRRGIMDWGLIVDEK